MLIKTDFDVAQPVDKVWHFFDDIPQVERVHALLYHEVLDVHDDEDHPWEGRRRDSYDQPGAGTAPTGDRSDRGGRDR